MQIPRMSGSIKDVCVCVTQIERLEPTISQTSNGDAVKKNQTIILVREEYLLGSYESASCIEAINEQLFLLRVKSYVVLEVRQKFLSIVITYSLILVESN